MARFDKVDSTIGVFRAVAAANVASTADYDLVLGVGLNASGKALLKAAGQSGFKGVTTVDRTKRKAGDILDVMTAGEIVECAGLVAGQNYYLTAAGILSTTVSQWYVGHTVEADRLIVRFESKGTYA